MEFIYKYANECLMVLIILSSIATGFLAKFVVMKFLAEIADEKEITRVKARLALLVGFSMFIVSLVIFSFFHITDFPVTGVEEKSQLGQSGDYIGGTLNPVLSFAALLALIINIQLQIKEFVKTRKELEHSAIAQKDLVFQSEFFSMLNSLEKLVQNYHLAPVNKSHVSIHEYVIGLAEHSNRNQGAIDGHIVSSIFELPISSMLFGRVITIFGLINTQREESTIGISPKEEKYAEILKLTLTKECIEMIAFMCSGADSVTVCYDAKSFRHYVEKYGMLQNLNVTHNQFFSRSMRPIADLKVGKAAFGKRTDIIL
jgi:hypothetical protein